MRQKKASDIPPEGFLRGGWTMEMFPELQRSALPPSLTLREGELDTCSPWPSQGQAEPPSIDVEGFDWLLG